MEEWGGILTKTGKNLFEKSGRGSILILTVNEKSQFSA